MTTKTTDPKDEIIKTLMDRAINPPIFVHPYSKLWCDLSEYVKKTKRITKKGVRAILGGSCV